METGLGFRALSFAMGISVGLMGDYFSTENTELGFEYSHWMFKHTNILACA